MLWSFVIFSLQTSINVYKVTDMLSFKYMYI